MGEIRKQLVTAGGIGVKVAAAELAATSGWMHRDYTHHAWRAPKAAALASRFLIWTGPAIKPRIWGKLHRDHHDYADMPATTEQPGDPHSPPVQGKWGVHKVALKNPWMYRNRAKQIEKQPLPADLQPDKLDTYVFDKTKLGHAVSLLGHAALNVRAGNPVYMAPVSYLTEKVTYIIGGNLVNAIGHAGKYIGKALLKGEITPHEDGTYGSDSVALGLLTFGEGMQKFHHENKNSAFFGPLDLPRTQKYVRDPLGALILDMTSVGIGEIGSFDLPDKAQIAA